MGKPTKKPEIYSYEPLNPTRNEIRLLKIKRSLRLTAPIVCSLHVASLDDVNLPKYSCLSYCWGKGPADRPVYCDGSVIWVTENLLDALRSLRRLTRRYLWVDQICINQPDLEERSAQVPLMRQIYPRAHKTFLYLGSRNDFSKFQMSYWKYLHQLATLRCLPEILFRTLLPFLTILRRPKRFLEAMSRGAYPSELHNFADRPCFTRAWILQEVGLSPSVVVMCNSMSMKWEYFSSQAVGNSMDDFNVSLTAVQNPQDNRLFELLVLSRWLKASDPRDKVYALLGLAPDAQEFPQPEYTLSVAEVYQNFASALVIGGCGHELLALAAHNDKTRGYPSWVPDWEQNPEVWLQSRSTFLAGKENGIFKVKESTCVLSVEGSTIDTILRTYPSCGEGAVSGNLLELVARTGWLVQNDSKASKIPLSWSSLRDLQVTLTLYLVFDHEFDGDYFDDPEIRRFWEGIFKKDSLASKAHVSQEIAACESEVDSLVEVLSDHLLRELSKEGLGCFTRLVHFLPLSRFAITAAGRLCLTRWDVQPGDKIAVILGCQALHILREDGEGFINIGQTYIRGLMHGEALDDERNTVQEMLIH